MSKGLGYLSGINKKILLAISYTDQFRYPLTKNEIFLRLIGTSGSILFTNFDKALEKLVLSKKILSKKGFYFLKGSEKNLQIRAKRHGFSLKKWQEVEEFIGLVRFVPWVKGVAVTGSLSVNNSKKNDDIDFLVVTSKNRLWLSRIFVVFFLFMKGKKRSWNGDEANSWCLNFWLDDSSLKLPKRLKNIYGAFEVCQAVWVYDKGNIKNNFFKLNSWAERFLPNYFSFQKNNKSLIGEEALFEGEFLPGKSRNKTENLSTENLFLDSINKVLFFLQYLYMKPHMTSEKVSISYAFFHPRDTRRQVMRRWLVKYKRAIN